MDLPIVLKKGARSYTIHPIFHFVSLQKLLIQHRAFNMQLFTHGIPITIGEAPSLEPWKETMTEEMRALEKNKT